MAEVVEEFLIQFKTFLKHITSEEDLNDVSELLMYEIQKYKDGLNSEEIESETAKEDQENEPEEDEKTPLEEGYEKLPQDEQEIAAAEDNEGNEEEDASIAVTEPKILPEDQALGPKDFAIHESTTKEESPVFSSSTDLTPMTPIFPSDIKRSVIMSPQSKKLDSVKKLEEIRSFLKKEFPNFIENESYAPKEKDSIFYPEGPSEYFESQITPVNTIHVDEFLINESELFDLVSAGKVPQHYCPKCGNRQLESLNVISHSMSFDDLSYIKAGIAEILGSPTLKDLNIIDIGSRLGPVVWYFALFTEASCIYSLEMNKYFTDIQEKVLRNFQKSILSSTVSENRIRIVNENLLNIPKALNDEFRENVDVVIINNSFQFFLSKQDNHTAWKFVQSLFKSGTILVCSPGIESSFADSQISGSETNIEDWVEPVEFENDVSAGIFFYKVK